jgi:hypothetical protein
MFVLFAFSVETSATNQLPATLRTVFMLAIRMMIPARHHIAIGTAEPLRKMEAFWIERYSPEHRSVRVLKASISLTGSNRCVRHFRLTTPANCHYSPVNCTFLRLYYYIL